MQDSSAVMQTHRVHSFNPGPSTSVRGKGGIGMTREIWYEHEVHAACCAMSSDVLCLWPRTFLSSASIHENSMQVKSQTLHSPWHIVQPYITTLQCFPECLFFINQSLQAQFAMVLSGARSGSVQVEVFGQSGSLILQGFFLVFIKITILTSTGWKMSSIPLGYWNHCCL